MIAPDWRDGKPHTYAWGRHMPDPYEWAVRFETEAKALLIAGNPKPLVDYESLGRDALLSSPTPDHYLPLLYVIGTRQQADSISFPVEGVDGGSISMLAVRVGQAGR
jgi:4,5-DOPA dioxygenase extradiol